LKLTLTIVKSDQESSLTNVKKSIAKLGTRIAPNKVAKYYKLES